MGGWGYGWRVAVITWAGLSALVGVVALVLTLFDSQYADAGVAGRLLAGLVAALFGMALCSPLTLTLACLAGSLPAWRTGSG